MPVETNVPDGLDAYIEQARQHWEAPACAVAVVKDDAVIFAKGYGARTLGKGEPVDEYTVFACGSTTKAFTAAALGMLVDAGKLGWDDRVTDHLPGFQLYDPYVTRVLTVRDLLCHRAGLERGDMLWYGSPFGRDEVVRRVRYLRPTLPFRARFGYQNIMYLVAGAVAAAVGGTSWDEFLKTRIFEPLGMARTNTSIHELAGMDNIATPHHKVRDSGAVLPIAWYDCNNIAPAGAINSCVMDMAQWLRLNLAGGEFEGERLLSEAVVCEMQSPQMIENDPDRYKFARYIDMDTNFWTYGLGWGIRDYHGMKMVRHGGGIDGMRAEVAMLPAARLGVVVLTNLSAIGDYLPNAVMFRALDAYLGAEACDWSADFQKVADVQQTEETEEWQKMVRARAESAVPSLAPDAYAGSYENEMYGAQTIALEGNTLVFSNGAKLTGNLEHWHHDTFKIAWHEPYFSPDFLTFALDAEGKVSGLALSFIPGYEFARVREQEEAGES
ncbi:MAG: serine hydrolase [Anaerolineae bacterium]|nr:serine hydrolase [Anaerolineae bacterium]